MRTSGQGSLDASATHQVTKLTLESPNTLSQTNHRSQSINRWPLIFVKGFGHTTETLRELGRRIRSTRNNAGATAHTDTSNIHPTKQGRGPVRI